MHVLGAQRAFRGHIGSIAAAGGNGHHGPSGTISGGVPKWSISGVPRGPDPSDPLDLGSEIPHLDLLRTSSEGPEGSMTLCASSCAPLNGSRAIWVHAKSST